MTLTLNSESARSAAALFRRLNQRSTLPILDCVRLTVLPGEMEVLMEVTDLDIHLAVRAGFSWPTTPGSFTLPKRDFFAIARAADRNSTVRFDCEEKPPHFKVQTIITTKAMRTHLEIIGLPPDEFPNAPVITGPPVIMATAALAAIRRVRPCASKDETRYVLNGVFISRATGGLAVATDGKRLAIISPTPIAAPDCILPNLVVDLLADAACQSPALWRSNGDGDDEDGVTQHNEIASLIFGKTTITFRTINGNYPNFRQVMPDAHNGSCTFPPAVLPALTNWLKNYAGETVKLTFNPAGNSVTLDVSRPDKGRFSTRTSAAMSGTVPDNSSYNATFLADALAMNLHTLDLIDARSPAVLTDGAARYVLMPMRLTAEADPAENPTEEESPAENPNDPAKQAPTAAAIQEVRNRSKKMAENPPEKITGNPKALAKSNKVA